MNKKINKKIDDDYTCQNKCHIICQDYEYVCNQCGRIYDYDIYDMRPTRVYYIPKIRQKYHQTFKYTLLNYQDNVLINEYYQKYFNHIILKKRYRITLSFCLLFKVLPYLTMDRIKLIHKSLI